MAKIVSHDAEIASHSAENGIPAHVVSGAWLQRGNTHDRSNDLDSGVSSSRQSSKVAQSRAQSVFVTSQGADGAIAEIEQRKFVAEEGDHLTLLNGEPLPHPTVRRLNSNAVYNAFVSRGRKSAKWCASHRLNFKALSRAVSIRLQLTKYLQRFRLPIVSCKGDDVAIRRCLVSGYFKNAAKFQPDGTYKLLTSDTVS